MPLQTSSATHTSPDGASTSPASPGPSEASHASGESRSASARASLGFDPSAPAESLRSAPASLGRPPTNRDESTVQPNENPLRTRHKVMRLVFKSKPPSRLL